MILVKLVFWSFCFFPKPKPGRSGDRRSVRFGFVTRRDYAGRRRETTSKDFCLETGEDASTFASYGATSCPTLSASISVNQRLRSTSPRALSPSAEREKFLRLLSTLRSVATEDGRSLRFPN